MPSTPLPVQPLSRTRSVAHRAGLPIAGKILHWVLALVMGLLAMPAVGLAAEDHVPITQTKPTITTKLFDKANPPKEMPPLTGNEAALCEYDMACEASTAYTIRDDGVQMRVKLTDVELKLKLNIIIWLPKGFTQQLKDHEEGHSTISQIVYKPSGEIAKSLAAPLIGKTFTVPSGTSQEEIGKKANTLTQEMCNQWIKRVAGDAKKVNDAFDDITAHGTKNIPVPEAIEQAFKQAGVKKPE